MKTTGDKQDKTAVYMSDEEAEKFKAFCASVSSHPNWLELKEFMEKIQFGSIAITIKDGIPVRIDNPLQVKVLGIHLTK